MTDERTNGSLRACEHDATCHAPAIRQVRVLRPGWKVAEPRLYCFEHAAQVEAPAPPIATPKPVDHPVPRPLRAEVLAALQRARGPLSVRAITDELTRPATPATVRRELEALADEGLVVEGASSLFTRCTPEEAQMAAMSLQQRVLADVAAHPWTSSGDIAARLRDRNASARLILLMQTGDLIRIGEHRAYLYALPGTPIPGAGEPIGQPAPVADTPAESVADSPEWGVADPAPAVTERPRTLAERLAHTVGVDLTRGDVGLVEAVERIVAERDAAKARADRLDAMGSDLITDFLGGLRSALGAPAGDWSAAELITMVDAFRSEVVDELDRAGAAPGPTLDRLTAVVDELIQARAVPAKSPDTQALVTLRNAIESALDLAGACSDEDLIAAVRDAATTSALVREALQSSPFATPAEVTQQVIDLQPQPRADILATANANLREIGGGVAKRRVGCTVALGSGSAFFALSDEAARTLAPLLFQGVTIALLAPSLSKPTPVVPEFPTAPTPDDDADLFAF